MADENRTFNLGDSVKVLAGIEDPDIICNIEGWQGRITNIETDEKDKILFEIEWDSITLKAMPDKHLQECEDKGLDLTRMLLHPEDIEPTEPRDSEKQAQMIAQQMEVKSVILGFGDQGKRILEVIGNVDTNNETKVMRVWKNYFMNILTFPFDAVVDEFQERSPFEEGEKVTVLGIASMNKRSGVLVNIKKGWRKHSFPLCDIEVSNKKSPNYLPINDYRVWFANR